MGHSYTHLLVHVIFSTKDRRPLIVDPFQQRLYAYMAGVARQEFGQAVRIEGVADHVHGLLALRSDVSLAAALCKWKGLSSGWVRKVSPRTRWDGWQNGYAAFSVSESNVPRVIRYIDRQAEHHRRLTFEEELIALLKRHGMDYDPRRVWD